MYPNMVYKNKDGEIVFSMKRKEGYGSLYYIFEKNEDIMSTYEKEQFAKAFEVIAMGAAYMGFPLYDSRELMDGVTGMTQVLLRSEEGMRAAMKATTVSDKLPRIGHYFSEYRKVREYTDEDMGRISQDPTIIQNRRKIIAISRNAETFNCLVEKHGSFGNYLESFGPLDEDQTLTLLRYDLRRNFEYLGPITVYHLMMDLGLNVLKPDRVICRIMYRLGMIRDEEDIDGVIQVGRHMSTATGQPIRYIDIVLVKYGQMGRGDEFGLEDGICLKNNPKCSICGVRQYCNYF